MRSVIGVFGRRARSSGPLVTAVLLTALALVWATARTAAADTIRVPGDQPTIQAGVDAAGTGDTVLVQPGTYRERIRLQAGITLRSAGEDGRGTLGLQRAEVTIIDGNVTGAEGPGVVMAEGSTLDGFTVTGVGTYDDDKWKRHHATQGEEQSHEHIGAPGTAGISVIGINRCTVRNNIVHHVGYTGIAITGVEGKHVAPHIVRNVTYRNMGGGIGSMRGSTATIEANVCYENFYAGIGHDNASPLVIDNLCYANIRAGIGISEHASPIVRGNRCYENRRAGIGIRTGEHTAPLVERNECYANGMAGIGVRDDATPIIRHNRCYRNDAAGIGCRTGARPLIEQNACFENKLSGIGVQSRARAVVIRNVCRENEAGGIGVRGHATALIVDNQCLENTLVAIGVQADSTAHITGNHLVRTGGMPPMITVHKDASAVVIDNVIEGGGGAGILVHGSAEILRNRFQGSGPRGGGPPNFATWVRSGATVTFSDNRIDGWRHALHASGATCVRATNNTTSHFLGAAIVVQDSAMPTHAFGNIALSNVEQDVAVRVTGPQGVVANNERRAAPGDPPR